MTHKRVNFLLKFSLPSSTVRDLLCLEGWEEKDPSMYQSINDKGVCRTAPATPGVLNIMHGFEATEKQNIG